MTKKNQNVAKAQGAMATQVESANVQNVQVANELEDVLAATSLNKALREVFLETMKFKQAVRIFDSMGNMTMTIGKQKMTFAQLLNMVGAKYTNGKVDYKSLQAAWTIKSDDGYMSVYRNVTGKVHIGDDNTTTNAYTWNEEKGRYETARQFKRVTVEKWNAALILKGIAQMLTPATVAKQIEKSEKEWEAVEEVYIFDKRTEKGSVTNKARKVNKVDVEF